MPRVMQRVASIALLAALCVGQAGAMYDGEDSSVKMLDSKVLRAANDVSGRHSLPCTAPRLHCVIPADGSRSSPRAQCMALTCARVPALQTDV